MLEDKLTRDERIRLECLAQANVLSSGFGMTPTTIIDRAKQFERYIRENTESTNA